MGRILNSLKDALKTYLEEDSIFDDFGKMLKKQGRYSADPDVNAAYEELDDYLKHGPGAGKGESFDGRHRERRQDVPKKPPIPEKIKRDFAELGLSPEASPEECKGAYKKLLKIHHPDRHAGHPDNMRKATEQSARINAAFDRIEQWRKTGKAD
jgi:DnaJ-class molecular chaperone